jgi:predicted membrane protein (TIGR00267 family)
MRTHRSLLSAKIGFDLVAGLCDGILTALTLAAAKLLGPATAMSPGLALRVAVAAGASGAFIFFAAHYAVLRGELVEAERQLSLTGHGKLASTRLGRAALREAAGRALASSLSSFCGALLPLMVGAYLPVIAILLALAALAALGTVLGATVHGRPLSWAAGLSAGGIVLATLGLYLKIV